MVREKRHSRNDLYISFAGTRGISEKRDCVGVCRFGATRLLQSLPFSGHLHRDPPPGYARCTVSQLVAADKLVWQILLEEGVKPKRDDSGELALDSKLLSCLESHRVSFSLPLIAKKDNPSAGPKKTQPTVGGGKGVHAPVSKP